MTLLFQPDRTPAPAAARGGRHRAPADPTLRVATDTDRLRPGRHAAPEDDVPARDPLARPGLRVHVA